MQVVLRHQCVSALIDTGSSINLMAEDIYQTLTDPPPLRPTSAQVHAFGSQRPLDINVTRSEWDIEGTDAPEEPNDPDTTQPRSTLPSQQDAQRQRPQQLIYMGHHALCSRATEH
ncbi:hypothetical protein NDU88_001617 [Pleurodeles waltl]|uniref:Uncharacterized protein n=1 Tax=Pleurodeles waltl TaxID=8319 RepID=A0AAV7KQR2_PLEWA|nr:hypothetical protein NDU88_001617 [Pleurodeles waltl]